MSVDLRNSDKLLTTTRGVRKRLDFDKPVDPALIESAVKVALQAPTAGELYPVEFVVVTDPARRKQMGEIYADAHLPYLDEFDPFALPGLAPDGVEKARRHIDLIRWHTRNVHRAPVHVHVVGKGRYTHEPEQPDFQQASLYGCVLPPAWSLMLALRARGIGSSWCTIHTQEPFRTRTCQLLELPENYSLGVFLPCGYYTGKDFKPAERPAINEVLHWNEWSNSP